MSALVALLAGGVAGGLLKTGLTMLLSIVAYGYSFGWSYGLGLVAMLAIHEMGHYVAARQCGLAVGLPTFIPFVGAWVDLKDTPLDAETEVYIAIAGPFVGTLSAFGVYYLGRHYDSGPLLATSYIGFVINLFNLIPVLPLDGGRITAAISPQAWWIGFPILIAVFLYQPNPLLLVVAAVAFFQVVRTWRQTPEEIEADRAKAAPLHVRVEYGALYLILTAVLAAMTASVHNRIALF